MTDIEGFLTIYGHSDNLLNNNTVYKEFQVTGNFETEGPISLLCLKLEMYDLHREIKNLFFLEAI